MYQSRYIDSLPEAEYEVLDPVDLGIPKTEAQLSGFYGSIIDLLTMGNRGKAFTWALNGSGLSTNPAALDAAYNENKEAVNAYLQHVDLDEIIQLITQEKEDQQRFSVTWFRQRTPAFLTGAAIGLVGLALFKN